MKKLSVNGKDVNFYTVGELCNLAGKTTHAIYKLESYGVLPKPNFRTPPKFISRVVVDDQFYEEARKVYNKYKKTLSHESFTGDERETFNKALALRQILQGDRLYSEFIVEKLAEKLKQIRQGKQVSGELKANIIELFKQEIDYYA